MAFYVKNESKIELLYINDKIGSEFIAAKNGQNAFLDAENWSECCALLKMLRGNTTNIL